MHNRQSFQETIERFIVLEFVLGPVVDPAHTHTSNVYFSKVALTMMLWFTMRLSDRERRWVLNVCFLLLLCLLHCFKSTRQFILFWLESQAVFALDSEA